MHVTMQLDASAVSTIRGSVDDTRDSSELLATLAEFGVELEPIGSETSDHNLGSWFTAEVADSEAADRLIARLGGNHAVTAIYVKPPDEAP